MILSQENESIYYYLEEQLRRVRLLKDNWYEPGVGKCYSPDDLEWVIGEFLNNYPKNIPLDFSIFPSTEDDEISIEYDSGDNKKCLQVYINIKNKSAIIYLSNLSNDEDEEFIFKSIDNNFWIILIENIRKLKK
jgi:hypothetical protein